MYESEKTVCHKMMFHGPIENNGQFSKNILNRKDKKYRVRE